MSVCGAGSSPYVEAVAGTSTQIRLTAVGADGQPIDVTNALIEMRVATIAGASPDPATVATYSTAGASPAIAKTTPLAGVFTVTTSAAVDTVAGFFRYLLTVTPSGATPYVLAHGVYAVAQP